MFRRTKRARLLLCDGKLAGGLISYDGATHEERRRNTWVMPDGRLLSSGDVPETMAGEYYLDSLAIVPEFRGYGLWRMLFDDAIEKAKEKGFHRVTFQKHMLRIIWHLVNGIIQIVRLCTILRSDIRKGIPVVR